MAVGYGFCHIIVTIDTILPIVAQMNSQFTIDEDDQEMETQPIYLSSDESEIA